MSKFRIHIDRIIYQPGEEVTGHLVMEIDAADRPREIRLSVKGSELIEEMTESDD